LGVADTPLRLHKAEALLLGASPGEALFRAVVEAACSDLDPPADLHASAAYRREVASVLVSRALQTAAERASQEVR